MKRMIISMIVVLSIQLSYAQENSTETKEITTTLKVYKQKAKKKDLQGLTEVPILTPMVKLHKQVF